MTALHIDPLAAAVQAASNWVWRQVVNLAGNWMSETVLRPLSWPAPVLQLYTLSRDLAWALAGLLIVLMSLKSMWPQLSWSWTRMSPPLFLERLVAAALIGLTGIWGVQAILEINNGLVSSLLANTTHWQPGIMVGGALSPLVVLVVGTAMLFLMLYLALFYAVRAIEIFVLTASIPWFALWWATRDDDAALTNLARELSVVIFIQSFHAGTFWLAVQLLSASGSLGMMGLFMELALLWYMTKLPGQLRRLVGVTGGGTRLWR